MFCQFWGVSDSTACAGVRVCICRYVYRRALVVNRETDTEVNTQYVVPTCVHDTEKVVGSP